MSHTHRRVRQVLLSTNGIVHRDQEALARSVDNEFFLHVFNTQSVRKDDSRWRVGVKVHHTSPIKDWGVSRLVPNVDLPSRRQIVSNLDDLDDETQHLESIYERKLAALDALKKSLLHQAFTGKL